jgi:hypothetical protein
MLAASALPDPVYGATALKKDYPGLRDGPFADIARDPLSPIHVALWALKNSPVLPEFTPEQFVAGILFTNACRYLEPIEIWTKFAALPAVLPWAYWADQILRDPTFVHFEECWDAPVIRALKDVRLFLEREMNGGGMEFALADALNDPEWVFEDKELKEEQDIEEPRPFNYDYGDGSYLECYQEERDARAPYLRTLGIDEHVCVLKVGKENDVFANYLCSKHEKPAKACRTFTRFLKLPIEVQEKIVEYSCLYAQTIKVTARLKAVRPAPDNDDEDEPESDNPDEVETHVKEDIEELSTLVLAFNMTGKTPHGLVWMGLPSRILGFRRVSKEYDQFATRFFFSKNTFEVYDASASLPFPPGHFMNHYPDMWTRHLPQVRVVAHRWLEYIDKHKLSQYLRKLNVDINLDTYHQHKWHVRRTFAVIVSIKDLKRLIIDLEMKCLIGGNFNDGDVEFWHYAECFPKQWPGVRMLSFAKIPDVYIPKNRLGEAVVKDWMDKPDHKKFYSAADWDEPAEGFASDNIAGTMASVRARQDPQQKWISWDEGSIDEDSDKIEYVIQPDTPYYDNEHHIISRADPDRFSKFPGQLLDREEI